MSKRSGESLENGTVDKKLDTTFTKEQIKDSFSLKIWQDDFQLQLEKEVQQSQPFSWGTIRDLIDDTLLRAVRKEVLSEIAFTKKETDIYKVYQSGDLANLSGLDWNDLSRLPNLYKLRAAIYSEEFRDVVSRVTGCGKLSGVKTDMSINTYTKGCHLLTHDDVIGSRRVSFILYLPDPDRVWKSQYGGGLRLFPAIVPNVPHPDFSEKLVPQFNQIAFFTVQPGLSFHDVEEVREDKHRLSIQGWFHIPQPGEPGYISGEQEQTEAKSTLQQLQSKELQEFDFPKPFRDDLSVFQLSKLREFEENQTFSEDELAYLKKYVNAAYLSEANLKQLAENFIDESIVEINEFLTEEFAKVLKDKIRDVELNEPTPKTSAEIPSPWKCSIPPHKQRYMYIDGKTEMAITKEDINKHNNIGPQELPNFNYIAGETADGKLCELASFLTSVVFKKWLKKVTSLVTTSEQILVRRFRPGQDFILATTTEKQIARNNKELNAVLEATINLTPTAVNTKNWQSGEFGGYELCMSTKRDDSDNEEDDPAIYKSSDGNDDSVLYTNQCKWNSITLMLRDPSVLKFIKYVSINAKGSRWDITGQWNVEGEDGEEEDGEEEEGEE